jgi:xylan 1,4-beta-xylosidase
MPTETRMKTIQNPILKGFNPDPSILRVGPDYYIATSTFEWFPGVQIHHSQDLVNWRLITRPLADKRQLDMIGVADSGGVWAPCLTYSEGQFYLVYSIVTQWRKDPYKIVDNFLVTAESITGEWSDPIYLNSSGFDPSLFHDPDGRKYLVSMEWDHRRMKEMKDRFSGILLQEYCVKRRSLVGPVKKIFAGSSIGHVEGPHIYKRNGYYYLLTAEGGTEYNHAVTMARSESIEGPYQTHPENPVLTSAGNPELALQKAGHGSLVETPDGDWYMAHLCSRPIDGKHCILGRETALQKCIWGKDGWLYLSSGDSSPSIETSAPTESLTESTQEMDWDGQFNQKDLDIHFQSLRQPKTEDWLSLTERPGWLRLTGGEPTTSLFRQSMIARRVQEFQIQAETAIDFNPINFKQMAGLIAYYDTDNHYYCRISHTKNLGRTLNVIQTRIGESYELLTTEIPLPAEGIIHLRVHLDYMDIGFDYSLDGEVWQQVIRKLPSIILSDDFHTLSFTGAFVGICAQDQVQKSIPAYFKYFTYQEGGLDRGD